MDASRNISGNIHKCHLTNLYASSFWGTHHSSKELVDFLFEQPYCKIRFLVSRNMAKARTASKYSCQLHERGFLDVPSIGCKKRLSTHNCGIS